MGKCCTKMNTRKVSYMPDNTDHKDDTQQNMDETTDASTHTVEATDASHPTDAPAPTAESNDTPAPPADGSGAANPPAGNGSGEEKKKPRKVPKTVCCMCHRTEDVTGPMIRLQGSMYICKDCMQKTIDMMTNGMNPGGAIDFGHIKNISFMNMSDLQEMFQHGPKVNAKPKEKKAEAKKETQFDIRHIPAPHKIKESLDEYVIGQEQAKKIMSVGVYNHYKRVLADTDDGVEIEKSNMLMIGPTGCGKTYLVQTLAKILDVPLAITDATSLTEAGYIGDDIESVVSKLLAAADNDVEKAEHGIIFIDEIDKIAKKHNANQRDVSGESVQQGMLKLLEGSVIDVPVGATSKSAMVPMTEVDTRNILFICGGAFPELEDIIKERLNKEAAIGFKADLKDRFDGDENILRQVQVEDVRKFGMIPEFLGRLPILFTLDALTEDMLVDILVKPKNAILKQYQKLLAMDEVDLQFTQEALEEIAHRAKEKNVGARALRAIIEDVMLDIMYEIPKDDNIGRVTITKEYINKTGGPIIELRGMEPLRIESHE